MFFSVFLKFVGFQVNTNGGARGVPDFAIRG